MEIQESWVKSDSPIYKYEDLFASNGMLLFDILDNLDINYSHRLLSNAIKKHSFEKSFGRKPGDTDIMSHGRNGLAGNWKEHQSKEIDAIIEKNFKGHLKLTGYEP